MKRHRINKSGLNSSANALTLVEVLVSIVVVALLAALLIPAFAKARPRSKRINCVSNLKQVGLAYRMWSNDHGEKFPWAVSTTNGGTLEFASFPDALPHYLAISNELSSPKVLRCFGDIGRTAAPSWDVFSKSDSHLSYFAGLDADENKPFSILSGDRNLNANGRTCTGLVTITNGMTVGWTSGVHSNAGNLGFGDGSAHQVTSSSLSKQIQSALSSMTNVTELRFAVPKSN